MKYYINEKEVTEQEFNSELENAVYDEVADTFDDLIDDTTEEINIWGMTYYPSEVLKNVDPVAYRCGLSDEVSARLSDYQYEFRDEHEEDINGDTFRTEEEVED